MEKKKIIAWIRLLLTFITVLWVIFGALLILSFPYLQIELIAVFALSTIFSIILPIIYVEVIFHENNS